MWAEGLLRSIAEDQYGLVAREQLRLAGATDNDLLRRIEAGRLQRLHPGVYYLDSTPTTWRTRVLAGVLAAGSGAVASHRTAAVLRELDAIRGRVIEVTVPYDERPEPGGVLLHRTRRANPHSTLDGIPISPIDKNLLDLAPLLPEQTLVKVTRSAVRKGLTNIEMLDLSVGTYGGRGVAGTRKMRRVIRVVAEDQSGSVAEIDLMTMVLGAPVPLPVQQLEIVLPDGSCVYPDLAWPDRRRLIEADGFETHGTPEALRYDLWRQNQLMDLQWELRRFTATDIRDRPNEVRDEIIRFVNAPFREGFLPTPGRKPSQNGLYTR